MIKNFLIVIMQLIVSASCYADRYIQPDNEFDDQYDKPMWWLVIYFFIGLWAFTSDKGPLKAFGERHTSLSWVLFLFIVPFILFFIFER